MGFTDRIRIWKLLVFKLWREERHRLRENPSELEARPDKSVSMGGGGGSL